MTTFASGRKEKNLTSTLNDPDAVLSTERNLIDLPEHLISTFTFDIDAIDHVFFEGLGGDDIFHGEADVAVTADGGSGKDILFGGTVRNELIGDSEDTLYDPVALNLVRKQVASEQSELADANRQLKQAQRQRVRVTELETQRATEIERQRRDAANELALRESSLADKQGAARCRGSQKDRSRARPS